MEISKIIKFNIPDVILIQYKSFYDSRGSFSEVFREDEFNKIELPKFIQENISISNRGVIRGLHYQLNPKAQAKLVHCVYGSVLDVVVDLRKRSSTFGQHIKVNLDLGVMLYVPVGFAHGFMALENNTTLIYKISNYYVPELDRSIKWNDPKLDIAWPFKSDKYNVSEKDANAPLFDEAEKNF